MCGIVGAYEPTATGLTSNERLMRMRDRMAHRGPDGEGIWRSPREDCVLGHRRLSIIDLSEAAGQPMASPDGSVVIVFNGEIYNHAELRKELTALGRYHFRTDHSDTEVLLCAFMEWGKECVHRLFGMFAFAIYDGRKPGAPELHLVRDRFGVKPLYFSRTDSGEWLFASEIKALLIHPHVRREMNQTAFWHYLTFIVAPAPMTLFDGVFKLPAGYWATIDSQGRAEAFKYWSNAPKPDDYLKTTDISLDEASEEFLRLMRVSIERRMVSDVPFGVLLSGGVDSSLNVALMSELMDRPVSTFTVGYEGQESFNEFGFARRIADRYRTDHHETRITAQQALDFIPQLVELQDEPIADNVNIPLYFLSKLVRDSGTTVVQVGEGADENFLGYWWCQDYADKERVSYLPSLRGNRANPALTGRLRNVARRLRGSPIHASGGDAEVIRRAQSNQELFWGGATCWWGSLREQITPTADAYVPPRPCPIEGLMPEGLSELDSHALVRGYYTSAGDVWDDPEVLRKIPFLEHSIRLPEHLLMRVDKMTMAHSIEARVPFLDHELVEFSRRIPSSYKLSDGIGKRLIKHVSEPYVDHDLLYRKKQGFGAPMDQWFTDPEFGASCLGAWQESDLNGSGLIDDEFFGTLLMGQVEGKTNWGFHVWTVMNAVFWYRKWIQM